MFSNFIEWRRTNNVDTIITDFEFPEDPQVKLYYPFCVHAVDKQGRPVSYTQVGKIDCDKLFEATTMIRMQKHFWVWHEKLMKHWFPACSLAAGRRIDNMTVIFDFSGSSMSTLNRTCF